jgi:hypothetical protein|tara:strand:+ start:842 stop:1570 length:729 start_codon:yes stop_codon:yes gene_type:complete
MKPHISKPKKPEIKPISENITSKEIISIIIAIIIASFVSFLPIIPNDQPVKIITTLFLFTIIIFSNILTKRFFAKHYSIKIEHKFFEFSRWAFPKRAYFQKPFSMGLVFSFFIGLFSVGIVKPFAFLQFNAENITKRRRIRSVGQRRALRKEAYYINDTDLGYTAASGFYSLLILALIGSIISLIFNLQLGADLAKYSIFYGLWNLIPYGKLDGSRLFFGVFYGWIFITLLNIIALALTLLL